MSTLKIEVFAEKAEAKAKAKALKDRGVGWKTEVEGPYDFVTAIIKRETPPPTEDVISTETSHPSGDAYWVVIAKR